MLGRRLVEDRDVPDVEVDRPERQRDQRMGEVAQPVEPADREQRLQQRPGQAEHDQERPQVAHQQVLDHVGEEAARRRCRPSGETNATAIRARPDAKQTIRQVGTGRPSWERVISRSE